MNARHWFLPCAGKKDLRFHLLKVNDQAEILGQVEILDQADQAETLGTPFLPLPLPLPLPVLIALGSCEWIVSTWFLPGQPSSNLSAPNRQEIQRKHNELRMNDFAYKKQRNV